MIGWILGGWVLSALLAWRPLFRRWDLYYHDDWGDIALIMTLVTIVALMAGPLALAWFTIVYALENREITPQQFGSRLAGKPRETRQEKLERLERENERLEIELGLRQSSEHEERMTHWMRGDYGD